MTREDAERWARGLEEGRFGRFEPRRRAQTHLRGLLLPVMRKNGWRLAAVAGDRTPDGVQDVLARAHRDADLVLRRCIARHGRGYGLSVTSAQRLGLKPVEDWLGGRAGPGLAAPLGRHWSTRPRLYDGVDLPGGAPPAPGWRKGLLIRRKIKSSKSSSFI